MPSVPLNVQACVEPDGDTVTLRWDHPSSGAVTHYQVRQRSSGEFKFSTEKTFYEFPAQKAGLRTYSVRACGRDDAGKLRYSAAVSASITVNACADPASPTIAIDEESDTCKVIVSVVSTGSVFTRRIEVQRKLGTEDDTKWTTWWDLYSPEDGRIFDVPGGDEDCHDGTFEHGAVQTRDDPDAVCTWMCYRARAINNFKTDRVGEPCHDIPPRMSDWSEACGATEQDPPVINDLTATPICDDLRGPGIELQWTVPELNCPQLRWDRWEVRRDGSALAPVSGGYKVGDQPIYRDQPLEECTEYCYVVTGYAKLKGRRGAISADLCVSVSSSVCATSGDTPCSNECSGEP